VQKFFLGALTPAIQRGSDREEFLLSLGLIFEAALEEILVAKSFFLSPHTLTLSPLVAA
jgi:hypothetical protein